MHNLAIIAILEPFEDSGSVMIFQNQLAMDNGITKCNGKILLFWNGDVDCIMRDQNKQQINCDFSHNGLQTKFTMIFAYGKCKDSLRRTSWKKNAPTRLDREQTLVLNGGLQCYNFY